MRLFLITIIALTAVVGCGKKNPLPPKPIPGSAHVQGTVHTDEVVTAWRSAGLETDGFTRMDPPTSSAAFCEHGLVRGVDTTVCEYANEDTISRGMQEVNSRELFEAMRR